MRNSIEEESAQDARGVAAARGPSRRKRAIGFWIAALVALELIPRISSIISEGPRGFFLPIPDRRAESIPAENPEMGFRLVPELDRSKGYGPETAPLRILCIGNSNVFGHYVPEEHAFPAKLQARLFDSGVDAHVVNAGVPGHTARNIRAHLEERLKSARYDLVVFTAGWNDLHAAAAPSPVLLGLAAPGPPPAPFGRIGIFRVADALLECAIPLALENDRWDRPRLAEVVPELERFVAAARGSGARVYALDLPSGLAEDDGEAERRAVEKVVYPPVRRFSPAGYRALLRELLGHYRGTLTRLNVPVLKSGLEYEVPWREKEKLILDQCHPGPRGNERIVDSIITRMREDGMIGAPHGERPKNTSVPVPAI